MTPTLPTELPWITNMTPPDFGTVVVLLDLGPRYASYDYDECRWRDPDGKIINEEVYGWRNIASQELDTPRWYEANFYRR